MNPLKFTQGKEQISDAREGDATISIIAGGDFYASDSNQEMILNGQTEQIIAGIKPYLDSCDYRIINLEAPLTETDNAILKRGPNLKMHPDCIKFLKAANIDIVTLANNHIGDFGPDSVNETIERLDAQQISHVGAGRNLEGAYEPLIVEKNGLTAAIINIAENEFGIAGKNKAGAASLDPVVNISQIRDCAEKADITLVFVHGGNETNPIPSPRMVKTCRSFIDAGADAVIANHTHCPQGIELWQHKPIVYSTGNWLFKSLWEEYSKENFWWHGYMVRLVLTRKKVLNLEVIPYTFGPSAEKIIPFEGAQKDKFCQYLAGISSVITDPDKLNRFFDAWCMRKAKMVEKWMESTITLPFDSEQFKQMLTIRNVFSCEAHHELMRNYLYILEDHREEDAEELVLEIERLQHASFLFD